MRQNIGSTFPLFPRTGFVRYEGEDVLWREEDLTNWNLYFTFLGKGEIIFPEKHIYTAAGEVLLLPPKVMRSYRVAEPMLGWGFYFLHFRPTPTVKSAVPWFDRLRPQAYMVPDPAMRNRIAATLEEMHQINLRTPDIAQRPMLLDALLDSVLLRVASAQGGVKTAGCGIDLRIEKVLEWLHSNLNARHTVDSLARVAGLSRSQFCSLFRAGMGRSPQEYLEERRLELARFYLISSAHSIREIAEHVGFEDPFYFSTRFKRRFEQSPSAIRKARAGRDGRAGKSAHLSSWVQSPE